MQAIYFELTAVLCIIHLNTFPQGGAVNPPKKTKGNVLFNTSGTQSGGGHRCGFYRRHHRAMAFA